MKHFGLPLLILTGVFIASLSQTPYSPPASAQDDPFSMAWADLETITLDNFGDLAKIYSVNLGEGSISIGDSFYADGQLSVAVGLFYTPHREVTETIYLLQATEAHIEITSLEDLTSSMVSDVDFSNTGELLSIATFDTVEVWNVGMQERVGIIDQQKISVLGLQGAMYSIDFHPWTDHLVTTNVDGLVEWDTAFQSPLDTWDRRGFFPLDIDFAPSGDIVAIGYMGGVVLADPNESEEMLALISGEASRSLMFNVDGSILGYISDGGYEVGLWYMATSERIIIIYPGYSQIGNDIGFNADGQLFMIATPHSLEFYNAATGGYRGKLDDYSGEMLSLSASNDGKFLITGHANGELNIWGVPAKSD